MVKRITILFLSWQLILFFFLFLSKNFIRFNPSPGFSLDYLESQAYFFGVWANFDGASYLNIASRGYIYPNFAYFPLLSLFIFVIHSLTSLPVLPSALLLNNAIFLISLFAFYKTAILDLDKKTAFWSIVLLLAFPFSFFYSAVYTETLFFFFSILTFYCARRSKWLYVSFFGFLATLTRFVGLALLPALFFEWWSQNGKKLEVKRFFSKKAFFILFIPLAVLSYGIYLQVVFGDFFLFQKSMAHWGQSKMTFPLQVLYRYLKIFLLAPKNIAYLVAAVELISTFFYFSLGVFALKKIRTSYGIWMITSLIIPIFTGTLQSMPRYILHLFPAFMVLGLVFKNLSFWWRFILIAIFLILQFIFFAMFSRGYFIA